MRWILGLMIVSFAAAGAAADDPLPLPKDKIEDKKDEKKETKEPAPEPEPPAKDKKSEPDSPVEKYVRLLRTDDNATVRKRIVIALMNMEDGAKPAIPALLLAASPDEKDAAVRKAASTAIGKFSAIDVVDVLSLAVRDETLDAPQRRVSCKALAAFFFHPKIEPEKRKSAYEALEKALTDSDDDVRLAAATSLEAIDRKVAGKERVVIMLLDLDGLKRSKLTPEHALDAVKKAYPKAQVQLLGQGKAIEWTATDSGDTTLLSDFGKIIILERPEGTIVLRDVARIVETNDRLKK